MINKYDMVKSHIKKLLILSIPVFIFAVVFSTIQNTNNISYSLTVTNKVKLKIENLAITRTPTGITEIKGNIFNNSTSNVDDLLINMAFYDKVGKKIDNFERYATQPSFILKPAQSHSFDYLEMVAFYKINKSNVTAIADIIK